MHISLVTHNIVRGDGQGRVNYELVRYGASRGHRFTLYADQVDHQLLRQSVQWVPIRPRLGRPNLLKVPLFAREAGRATVENRRRQKDDLLVINGYSHVGRSDVNISHFVHAAWLASPVHTARVTSPPYCWYQSAYTRLNRHWEHQAYRQAGQVVAVSDAVRDQLVAGVGLCDHRVRVIPNGVDTDEFRPGRLARRAVGLPITDQPLAIFIGDIRTPLKNLDGVLKAQRQVPDLHLAVVGDTTNSPYPLLARDWGIDHRVHFLGYRDDVGSILHSGDFLVHPSRYDSFALVVLEAMASGLPVVTARTVGASPLVDASAGVVLDDPENVPQLAAAMQRLTADPQRRREMGGAARAIAERHTWDHMGQRYLELFQELAG